VDLEAAAVDLEAAAVDLEAAAVDLEAAAVPPWIDLLGNFLECKG
jgi:hypothetical protein